MFDDSFQNGFDYATFLFRSVLGVNLLKDENIDKVKRHLEHVISGEIIPSHFAGPPGLPPGELERMFPGFDDNYKESAARVLEWIEVAEQ